MGLFKRVGGAIKKAAESVGNFSTDVLRTGTNALRGLAGQQTQDVGFSKLGKAVLAPVSNIVSRVTGIVGNNLETILPAAAAMLAGTPGLGALAGGGGQSAAEAQLAPTSGAMSGQSPELRGLLSGMDWRQILKDFGKDALIRVYENLPGQQKKEVDDFMTDTAKGAFWSRIKTFWAANKKAILIAGGILAAIGGFIWYKKKNAKGGRRR